MPRSVTGFAVSPATSARAIDAGISGIYTAGGFQPLFPDTDVVIRAILSGITTNPDHGNVAQIGTQLTGELLGLVGGETVVHRWRDDAGLIAGANAATYTPVAGDDLETLRYAPTVDAVEVLSFGFEVRHAPPVAGSLTAVNEVQSGGTPVVNVSAGFTGSDLTYSENVDWAVLAGSSLTINDEVRNDTVTITATNSGGSASVILNVVIIPAVIDLATTIAVNVNTGEQVDATLNYSTLVDQASYTTNVAGATINLPVVQAFDGTTYTTLAANDTFPDGQAAYMLIGDSAGNSQRFLLDDVIRPYIDITTSDGLFDLSFDPGTDKSAVARPIEYNTITYVLTNTIAEIEANVLALVPSSISEGAGSVLDGDAGIISVPDGVAATLALVWQQSPDGISGWADIPGEVSASYDHDGSGFAFLRHGGRATGAFTTVENFSAAYEVPSAVQNLVVNSDLANVSPWFVSSGSVTVVNDLVTSNDGSNGGIRQNIPVTNGQIYNLSGHTDRFDHAWAYFVAGMAGGNSTGYNINLDNLANLDATVLGIAANSPSNFEITDEGADGYRISWDFTALDTIVYPAFFLKVNNGTAAEASGKSAYFRKIQLTLGSGRLPYQGTT